MSKAIWRAGEINFYLIGKARSLTVAARWLKLRCYLNQEALRKGVASAVDRGELVLGTVARSDRKAVADRGVKLFHRRIEPHAFGGVDSITDGG